MQTSSSRGCFFLVFSSLFASNLGLAKEPPERPPQVAPGPQGPRPKQPLPGHQPGAVGKRGHEGREEGGRHRDRPGREGVDGETSGPRRHHPEADGGPPNPKDHEARRAKRRAHLERLRKELGWNDLADPVWRSALKVHAWRLARLKRMRALAVEQKRDKVVERIDRLIEKENARYQAHLNVLIKNGHRPAKPVTLPSGGMAPHAPPGPAKPNPAAPASPPTPPGDAK